MEVLEKYVKVGLRLRARVVNKHLVYFPLSLRKFNRWVANRDLIRNNVFDRGYALHVFLSGIFGKSILQPFRVFATRDGHTASIYAYSEKDSKSLQEVAYEVATPDSLTVIDLDDILSKHMRFEFPQNQTLGFDIRVRPVRRLKRELNDNLSNKVFVKGSEIDVFLWNAIRHYPHYSKSEGSNAIKAGNSRSNIYVDWLVERFRGSVEIDSNQCRLSSYERSRIWRGNAVGLDGPDAVLHGSLIVKHPETFATFVRKGIGRHKAYGYGMILLRPPSSPIHR